MPIDKTINLLYYWLESGKLAALTGEIARFIFPLTFPVAARKGECDTMFHNHLLVFRWRLYQIRNDRRDYPYWLWVSVYVGPPQDLAEWR